MSQDDLGAVILCFVQNNDLKKQQMPLTKEKKIKIIEELSDKLKRQKIAIFSDIHGIPTAKLRDLRRDLKKEGAEYKVAKKTLLDLALENAGINLKSKELRGEIGVALGYKDEVAPARILYKFSKTNETFKILACLFGKRLLDAKEVFALAKLPSREALWAQVVGTLQAPLQGLVNVLHGNIRNLLVVINKIKENRPK